MAHSTGTRISALFARRSVRFAARLALVAISGLAFVWHSRRLARW